MGSCRAPARSPLAYRPCHPAPHSPSSLPKTGMEGFKRQRPASSRGLGPEVGDRRAQTSPPTPSPLLRRGGEGGRGRSDERPRGMISSQARARGRDEDCSLHLPNNLSRSPLSAKAERGPGGEESTRGDSDFRPRLKLAGRRSRDDPLAYLSGRGEGGSQLHSQCRQAKKAAAMARQPAKTSSESEGPRARSSNASTASAKAGGVRSQVDRARPDPV
jgi:hypothetical protein